MLLRVFNTRCAMYAYCNRNGSRQGHDYVGMFRPLKVRRFTDTSAYTLRLLGEILVAERWMTLEVVAHESAHAGAEYARRVCTSMELDGDSRRGLKAEELLCLVTGALVNGIEKRWAPVLARRQKAKG